MNRSFTLLAAVALAVGRSAADDQAEARAVIDKALKAMGGEDKLKMKAAVWKARGKVKYGPCQEEREFTGTWSVSLPQRCRIAIDVGDKSLFLCVKDGDRIWTKIADLPVEDAAPGISRIFYGSWVEGLTPLGDKAFSLSLLKDEVVNDRPAVGVKVVCKDRPKVYLYFDKETGLLAGSRFFDGDDLEQSCVYSDYKEDDGFKHPTTVTLWQRGRVSMVYTVTEYKRLEKLDDKLFEKP